MPTSFLSADAGFPRLTNDIPMEERMNRVQQYLFLLLEQLRYVLSNLGEENFNEESLKQIGEAISGPIYSQVSDLQGNVSTLEQTAASLTSTVTNLSGDVSVLQQTATSLTTRITNAEGDISSLEQTATSLTTRIGNAEGDISSLEQTATSLTTRVTNAEGDISLVSQKADRIDWIVASGTSASSMTLTPEMAQLIADEITITGVVTFNDLETSGSSVINGDNIELKADSAGDSVSYLTYRSVNGNIFAEVKTRDNQQASTLSQDRYAFVIETPRQVDGSFCALKLISGDNMSLESGYMLFMKADNQIVMNNGSLPTRIQANNVSYSASSVPSDCYAFCDDGIYYGSRRIVTI